MKDADVSVATFAKSSEWPFRCLGEIIEVLDSKRKPITKRNRTSGPYPYYGATGVLDWVDGYIFDEPLVLIGEDGAKWGPGENSAFSVKGKVWVNNHAHVMRPIRDEILDEWLIYYLNGADLSDFISGMTVPKLNQGRLREIPIPLPPLDEQKRIVAVLDKAFAALNRARAHAEANLADASRLYQQRREFLLTSIRATWKQTTVGEVCDRFEYGTSAKSQPIGCIPVLRMGNLQDGEIDWTNLVYTDDDGDIQKLALRTGDVLFNRTNSVDHVGKTAIYRGEREAIFAGYLIRLHLKEEVEPEFMNIFLNSDAARNHGRSVMGKSVNQANISASKLKDYPLWLPPLEEQIRLVQSIGALRSAVDDLKSQYSGTIADIADLRQSILQKAFSGQLI